MINALPDEDLTPDSGQEDESQANDYQEPEDETSADKVTEPSEGKNAQHAIQLAREREKREREAREKSELEAIELKAKLEEIELQGMSEIDAYRIKAERSEQEAARLKEIIQGEELKKEYRRWLSEKETEYPRTVSILKKQMERDIYPVQGATSDAFEENFVSFAADIEDIKPQTEAKVTSSNPKYTDPDINIDTNTLSAADLRKLLPIADKNKN